MHVSAAAWRWGGEGLGAPAAGAAEAPWCTCAPGGGAAPTTPSPPHTPSRLLTTPTLAPPSYVITPTPQGYGSQKFVFQGVHETICYGPSDKPWGDDEPRINQIVFIGRGLNRKALMMGFK